MFIFKWSGSCIMVNIYICTYICKRVIILVVALFLILTSHRMYARWKWKGFYYQLVRRVCLLPPSLHALVTWWWRLWIMMAPLRFQYAVYSSLLYCMHINCSKSIHWFIFPCIGIEVYMLLLSLSLYLYLTIYIYIVNWNKIGKD